MVRNLTVEQIYQIMGDLHNQATGRNDIAPVNTSEFVSMATNTLASGFDNTLSSLMVLVGRTIFSSRPYERKFKGLEMSGDEWGAITRKISVASELPEANKSWDLVDGQSVDHYVVKKPDVLETRYFGSATFGMKRTYFLNQLNEAFRNEQAFGNFVELVTQEASNDWEQYLEELTRSSVANMIGAKVQAQNGVIHLLTEYNSKAGLTTPLTNQTVYQSDNFIPFMKWVYSRIGMISDRMTERSNLFQIEITGKNILRNTPVRDQKIYMSTEALREMDSMVLSGTFHDNYLKYADVESVGYWPAIQKPNEIDVTPVYIDGTGALATGQEEHVENIFGAMFDRNAVGYNIYDYHINNTPLNAAGDYWNVFYHGRVQLQNDATEKFVVLLLD